MRKLLIILSLMFSVTSYAAENSNRALSDLSIMFFNEPSNPVYGIKLLDRRKLDFSINSLAHVDKYLESVRTKKIKREERLVLILRAGAYVGEVLRKNDPKRQWDWLSFEQARKLDKKTFEYFGKSISTIAILHSRGEFLFPLGKVEKYLNNGSGDSVKFFVQVFLSRSKLRK